MTTKTTKTRQATTKAANVARAAKTDSPSVVTETRSQTIARLITHSDLSAATLLQYTTSSEDLKIKDLLDEMHHARDEVVAGNLGRVERILATQLLTLDAMFNQLAQRAGRQADAKTMEVMMRLALKAQTQARATAEALSSMKNPRPYIKQANIAHGHQQVNNGSSNT